MDDGNRVEYCGKASAKPSPAIATKTDPGTIWRESVKALMATGSSVGTVVGINRPSTACAISVRLIGIMVGLLTVVTPLMVGFVFDVENVSFHV